MPELPTGTVTFLFTDIEGSTRLLRELGDAYADALAEHRHVLRDAFARHGGVEVDTQGDAFFVAFARASDALAAARDAQAALDGPIRVRMGVHTGEPLVIDEGYVGIDVHRAARIAAVGHGGQILVSQSTRDLVGADGLRDLGEHRLKDLTAPERIYQLGDGDFPPLKTLHQTNLPVQPTPLVGRERELRELTDLLRTHRLVTLTGAGGSGKTRLALQAAAELVDDLDDGVWFVSLAALSDAALVESTISSVVGAKDDLQGFFRGKRLLLVLDNLEQLLPDAAPLVARLDVSRIVTSRERLNVYGEQEYPVPTLPPRDAAELFTARARQLKPKFDPDEHVLEIANRLDGLPLAVELAAARVKVLTTKQILERLGHSLGILTAGARDAPERQRTVRGTIQWSYDLLGPIEQELLVRLGVFAGSFDLEAAEDVADANLETLASLVDKSLLRQTDEGRFFMLETIREYALERLEASSKAEEIRLRHASFFERLAEEAGPHMAGEDQPVWLARLEHERDNLRAALAFLSQAGHAQPVVRIAVGAWRFWWMRSYVKEGRAWLEEALQAAEQGSPEHLAAFEGASFLAYVHGDFERASALTEEWLSVARVIGDPLAIGMALHMRASVTLALGDSVGAAALERESLALCGDDPYARYPASGLAYLTLLAGDFSQAETLLEQSLERERAEGDLEGVANLTGLLGLTVLERGDKRRAASLLCDCADLSRALGHARLIAARSLQGIAVLFARNGEPKRAAVALGFAEALLEEAEAQLGHFAEQLQERTLAILRAQLTHDELQGGWEEGRRLRLDVDLDTLVEEATAALD